MPKLINGKIPASGVAESFREIVGWPYVSPGSNDRSGIDCSGAWCRCFSSYGLSIYHGSNTIWRTRLTSKGEIKSVADLKVGMAVLKRRFDGNEPDKYKSDGDGNFYHIGGVVSVNPLQIIHATPDVAKIDTKIGNWTHWGIIDKVDIDYQGGGTPVTSLYTAVVTAQSGSTVNVRATPSSGGALVTRLNVGTQVSVLQELGEFSFIEWQTGQGYMMASFLQREGSVPAPIPPSSDLVNLILPRETALALKNALNGVV